MHSERHKYYISNLLLNLVYSVLKFLFQDIIFVDMFTL